MSKKLSMVIYDLMYKKNIENPSDIWQPIGMGRRSWHALVTKYESETAQPPKLSLLWVAIGLQLDLEQTRELLLSQEYALTDDKADKIFIAVIESRIAATTREESIANAKSEAEAIRALLS